MGETDGLPGHEQSKETFQEALRREIEKLMTEMKESYPRLIYAGYRGGDAVILVEGKDTKDMNLAPVNVILVGIPGQMRRLDTSEVSGGAIRVLNYEKYEKASDYQEPNSAYVVKGVTEGPRGRIAYKISVSKIDESGKRNAAATSMVYQGKRIMPRIEYKEEVPLTQYLI